MINRLLIASVGVICATSATANEVAAIFGKAEYTGTVSDQIVFSEMTCGSTYDIEGICSINMTNLNAKYSTYINTQHLHWYKLDSMTVIPEEGVTLSNITLQCTESDYCDKLTASNGTAKYDKNLSLITWTGQASAPFTLAANASQIRVSYAVIEYTMQDQSAVDCIQVDDMADFESEPEYYTLSGIRVTKPTHGIYICRKGSKVSKIYIR